MSKAAIRVARPQGGRGAKFDSEHREKRVFTKNLQQHAPSAIRIPISRIRAATTASPISCGRSAFAAVQVRDMAAPGASSPLDQRLPRQGSSVEAGERR
jgi:hypothetical protein